VTAVFDAYARYYDLLYREKDYAAESRYVSDRIRERAPGARRILELGCGTGAHAVHLAQLGYEVHGIDLSENMVQRALARKRQLTADVAARISFDTGDVRSFRSGEEYDVVISLFHVMSYQTSNSDLGAAFATAAAHLQPGGLFLFDFWYGPAVLTEHPEVRVRRLEDDTIRVVRIAEPAVHTERNVVDVNYTLFVEDKASARVEQIRETHSMRYLFLPEIEQLASLAHFESLQAHAWLSSRTLQTGDWSGFVSMTRCQSA
jgi:SAM-dependent methyltransferase